MKEFKPLKELVKALTYIGDAIAGTNKSSNSQGESNDIYNGILKVGARQSVIKLSFGIKENDNATKLGDLFSDNFINDLNNDFITHLSDNEDEYYVSSVSKLDDEIIQTRAVPDFTQDRSAGFYYNNGILEIYINKNRGNYRITFSGEPLTKDTPLEKFD